jgi:hypothetical protein
MPITAIREAGDALDQSGTSSSARSEGDITHLRACDRVTRIVTAARLVSSLRATPLINLLGIDWSTVTSLHTNNGKLDS